ncbi:MAG: hypothetical protein QM736_06740 [Vicinamibacterales bacterium]
MVIKLISSLTPDDENVCAPALLQHFVSVLKQLPIAYAIRIETSDQVFQHSAPVEQGDEPADTPESLMLSMPTTASHRH